jgi:hypothetical protein
LLIRVASSSSVRATSTLVRVIAADQVIVAGQASCLEVLKCELGDVRFGSKADICAEVGGPPNKRAGCIGPLARSAARAVSGHAAAAPPTSPMNALTDIRRRLSGPLAEQRGAGGIRGQIEPSF